jgi:hypothetical protein
LPQRARDTDEGVMRRERFREVREKRALSSFKLGLIKKNKRDERERERERERGKETRCSDNCENVTWYLMSRRY